MLGLSKPTDNVGQHAKNNGEGIEVNSDGYEYGLFCISIFL
jgi:hypothetical protein